MSNIKTGTVASAAAKIAESNKASKEATADSGIAVGATVGGSMMSNAQGPAGVSEHKRAPGYYSRHAGKVRIGLKTWKWPMEAPLVPKEGEDDLKAHLDSMVERGLATLVK